MEPSVYSATGTNINAACSASMPEPCSLGSGVLRPDPRWLNGAGADLAACMYDDRDDVPATVEEILAGGLPRRVQACRVLPLTPLDLLLVK